MIALEPVLVASHPSLDPDVGMSDEERQTTAKSAASIAEPDFDLFLDPLFMDQRQQIGRRAEAIEVRMLDDILDDETELLDEELLELLAG